MIVARQKVRALMIDLCRLRRDIAASDTYPARQRLEGEREHGARRIDQMDYSRVDVALGVKIAAHRAPRNRSRAFDRHVTQHHVGWQRNRGGAVLQVGHKGRLGRMRIHPGD